MTPAPEDRFGYYRVDPKVNSNRASGAALVEPLPPEGRTPGGAEALSRP